MPYPSPSLYPSSGLYPEGIAAVVVPRLTFDPISEDASNAPLDILLTPEPPIMVDAMSFPAPALETVTAGSINTEGDLIAARRHQNRQIGLTLNVMETEDGAGTNYATNPRGIKDGTGWSCTAPAYFLNPTAGPVQAITDDPDLSYLYVTTTGAATQQGLALEMAGPFTAAEVYTARIWVYGYVGKTRNVRFGDASADSVIAATSHSGWEEITLTWTPASTWATAYIAVVRDTATADTIEITNVYVHEGTSGESYFDGDTPGCAWAGTARASKSIRPASGGARFRAIVADIQAKVSKLAAVGGTLRWANEAGDIFTFDILAADSYELAFDITYFTGHAAQIQVGLIAKPYARGTEVSYSSHAETTLPVLVFTETDVPGDVPALGRLVISENQGTNQNTVIWGLQSRYYDPAGTAALFYQAEALTPATATATAGPAGTSGSGNNTLFDGALTGSLHNEFLFTGTHVGSFRVYARAWLGAADGFGPTGDYTVRMTYRVRNGPQTVGVPDTALASENNQWYLFDLGIVAIPPAERGPASVTVTVQASNADNDSIFWDWIMLLPIEATGTAQFMTDVTPLPASGELEIAATHTLGTDSAGTYWSEPESYVGDRLFVPHAGPEKRTVRFIVKALRSAGKVDSATDDISAQLHVTPRFLSIQ